MRTRIFSWLAGLLAIAMTAAALTGCELDFSLEDAPASQAASSAAANAAASGDLQVYYLDVGQGDSELILLPDGDTILIDAGDRACADSIAEALETYGVEDIDLLIATHPHADHIGGMAAVIEAFDIGAIYMPKTSASMTPTTATYETLLETIADQGLKVKTGKAGVTAYDENGVTLEFLAPNSGDYGNLNNYSIVAKLTYGKTSFLFLGDAEQQSLNEILRAGYDLRCDVLKLGHHGSSNAISQELLEACRPDWGIISCGTGNSYGHPHQEALALLQAFDVTAYRTDEDGTILATSDGAAIEFQAGLPSVLPAA